MRASSWPAGLPDSATQALPSGPTASCSGLPSGSYAVASSAGAAIAPAGTSASADAAVRRARVQIRMGGWSPGIRCLSCEDQLRLYAPLAPVACDVLPQAASACRHGRGRPLRSGSGEVRDRRGDQAGVVPHRRVPDALPHAELDARDLVAEAGPVLGERQDPVLVAPAHRHRALDLIEVADVARA